MKNSLQFAILMLFSVLSIGALKAQNTDLAGTKPIVYVFDIDEEIAPPVSRRMAKAFTEARSMEADLILIHMNTYGGLVVDADTIRTRILNSKIPVAVFIDNNAASAGALISIACKNIYMRKSANIGAATVVNQTAQAMPDKYQSYMRATMRSTAEASGRDPKIAEAMVDQDIYIENISDSGKVLTFTASEAYKNGFCDSIVETMEDAIHAYGFEEYRVETLEISAVDNTIDWLISPYIQGILIMLIIGGIYFELQSPGMGFPSAAAIVAALLYFTPLYLEGLTEHWEILVFIVGIVLLMVEFFVIPGFGVAGILGILLVISGLVLSMVGNVQFDFSHVPFEALAQSFFLVVISIFGSVILSYYVAKALFGSKTFGLALNKVQDHDEGYIALVDDIHKLVGKKGLSVSILRPAGKVEIDDEMYDAVAQDSYIENGTEIEVVKTNNTQLVVKKCEDKIGADK